MFQPKTIAALLFVALAGGAAYLTLTRDDPRAVSREAAAAAARPLPALDKDQIDGLTITDGEPGKGGVPVVLVKRDGEWRLEKPVADRADRPTVERALDALAQMTIAPDVVARDPSSWERLQVRPEDVVRVQVRQRGAEVAELHLGSGEFARVGADGAVYRVGKVSRALFTRDLRLWRDREILRFEPDQVATVAVTMADGTSVMAKRTAAPAPHAPDPAAAPAPAAPPPAATWTLVAGQALVGELDPAVPLGLSQTLSHLDAFEIAEGATPATAGLTPPRMTVDIALEGGTSLALQIGAPDGDHYYVAKAGSERIWKVQKAQIENAAREPLQWRNKALADLVADEVVRMELTHAGEHLVFERAGLDWKVVVPAGLEASQAKLKGLAAGMRNLRGASIVPSGVKGTGLDKPTAVAVFSPKSGPAVTLTIGAKQDAAWYVRASGRPEVMLMNDYMARRFLKKADDFKPDKAPPPGPGGPGAPPAGRIPAGHP